MNPAAGHVEPEENKNPFCECQPPEKTLIRNSTSAEYFDREFYVCPQPEGHQCQFPFQWVDDNWKYELQEEQNAANPRCHCRPARRSAFRVSKRPWSAGREFYVCSKSNNAQCGFWWWVNEWRAMHDGLAQLTAQPLSSANGTISGPSAAARRSNLTHAREAAAAMPAKRAKVEAPDVDIKTELAVASLAEENIPLIAVKQENENGGVLKRETSGVAMKVERFAPEIKQEV